MVFSDLILALRLQLLDRFPHAASSEVLWTAAGVKHAFSVRWEDTPVSSGAIEWYQRFDRFADAQAFAALASCRHRFIAWSMRDGSAEFANAGPGQRHKNSFQVALAVDAHLEGAPATALPWAEDADPVLAVAIDRAIETVDEARLANSAVEARRIVESWGPGAKGVVSLRDPTSPAHRVFNAVNLGSETRFLDYCESSRTRIWAARRATVDAELRADQRFQTIDERSGFASIRLWRTADCPGAGVLPEELYDYDRGVARSAVEQVLPVAMPAGRREAAFDRLWTVADLRYASWLVNQIRRGACTLDPQHYQLLEEGQAASLLPLTDHDDALLGLAELGAVSMVDGVAEITVPDTGLSRSLVARFVPAAIRSGAIDGLDDRSLQVCIDDTARQRLAENRPEFRPLVDVVDQPYCSPTLRATRRPSWIDANRGAGNGTRRTNCWNTASAVGTYLSSGAPSTSLPIYRTAPLRPTIPEYLKMVGATNPPVFVADRSEADAVVAAWGPRRHGLVVASLSEWSTHIFNVVHDGLQIRYLDAHTAEEGDFNFDVRWQRIGIVELGALNERLVADRQRAEARSTPIAQLSAAQGNAGSSTKGSSTKGIVGNLGVGLAEVGVVVSVAGTHELPPGE